MDEEKRSFCVHCGKLLGPTDYYCPECGACVEQINSDESQGTPVQQQTPVDSGTKYRIVAGALCGIWFVIAVYLGYVYAYQVDAIMDELQTTMGADWASITAEIPEEELRSAIVFAGYVLIGSGVLALGSAITAFLKKPWIVCLMLCILSGCVGLVAVLGIVGFLVAYLIYKAKNEFEA